MKKHQIHMLFGGRIRKAIDLADPDYESVREIRIRVGQPMSFLFDGKELFLEENGMISREHIRALRPDRREIEAIVEAACGYSGYAFEEEMKKGYLTIRGGHRIGLAGQPVVENGSIRSLKYITALNIRVAHEVTGCADFWKKYFYKGNKPCHMLLISPPGGGKTTMLREIIRIYSEGDAGIPAVNVGVTDERSEIGGCYRGERSFCLGMHTDVMDGCPKILGIEMLLRSMAPEVIAADEIGSGEIAAVEAAVRSGCKILATLHGTSIDDFRDKPSFSNIVNDRMFERYLILKGKEEPGKIRRIYDENFRLLWEEKKCI